MLTAIILITGFYNWASLFTLKELGNNQYIKYIYQLNNHIMELQKIDSYITEMTEMFVEAKKDYEYNTFAKTCKKIVGIAIEEYIQYNIKAIEEVYEKRDSYQMSLLMELLQTDITELIVRVKVANQVYIASIDQMNPCSELDSTLAEGTKFKIFIENEL